MPHVLIVDPDISQTHALVAGLKHSGHIVSLQPSFAEAHKAAATLHPDAIILCVELAGGSGYTVCNKLKKDDATRSIPLLLASAEATAAVFDEHRRLRTHADGYLFKPYDDALVQQALRTLLSPAAHAVHTPTAREPQMEQVAQAPQPNERQAASAPQDSQDPLMSTDAWLLLEGSVDVNQHTQVIRLPEGVTGDKAHDLIGEALQDIGENIPETASPLRPQVDAMQQQLRHQAVQLQDLRQTVDTLGASMREERARTHSMLMHIAQALQHGLEK